VIKGWFQKKMIRVQKEEIENFLLGLKGGNSGVVDLVVASTVYWEKIYKNKGLYLYEVAGWHFQHPMMALELNRSIKENQKAGNRSAATGLMVWLHTVRACEVPEIKYYAREMWKKLMRTSEDVEEIVQGLFVSTGLDADYDLRRVPTDFEPVA